jgi:uncharacterized protein with GYD domain
MASYVCQLNWTEQGAKNAKDTLRRAADFRAHVERLGGKVREHLYTLGECDIFIVMEFPDDETEAAAMVHLATLGNVRTRSTRAFTDEEAAAIIRRLDR